MIRVAPTVLRVAAALLALVLAVGVPEPALAQRQDIMQCMERCLRHEGRDQKETCKLRCADVPSVTDRDRPAGERDCMARHKACQKNCGRDRECHRACKAELMRCK